MTPLRPRRRLAGALLCLALPFAIFAPPAAANSDPTPKPGKVVADSGFRPATNGYGFQNYGTEEGVVDMNARSMRRLFGTRVCSQITGPRCTLTPAAEEWMNDQNSSMAGGHCFGMATTSQFFFQGFGNPSQPDPFGSEFISELQFDGNTRLQRHIATAWATQSLKNVQKTFAGGRPSAVVRILRRTLERGRTPFALLIFDDQDGHAITPYAVNRLGENQWQLLVYDNNWPGRKRALNINTKRETWRYQIQPGTVWGGDAKTKTIAVGNPRPALSHRNPCPFCKDDAQADDDTSNDAPSGDVELRLASPAPGTAASLADFEVTREGAAGAVGLGPDGSYDTLAGASAYQPVTGVLFTDPWENTTYPQLTLDAGGSYDLNVSRPAAVGTARGGTPPVTGLEQVTMSGAGYSLGAEFAQGIGETANVSFDPTTRSVSFAEIEGAPQDVDLGLTTNAADADYDIDVTADDLPAGTTLELSVDPAAQQIEISASNEAGTPVDVGVTTLALSGDGSSGTTRAVQLDGDGTTETLDY